MKKIKIIICLFLSLAILLANVSILNAQNKRFTFKDVAVFYPQHQDDEVLWAGSAIVEAIEKCGEENVYVVLVSDGTGIKYLQDISFSTWTRKEKSELRKNEFRGSLASLGVLENNIIFLDELNENEGVDFDLLEKVVLGFENEFKGNITHVAHTYKLDWHLQHIKNGAVIKKLYDKNKIQDCAFFIKPEYEEEITVGNKILINSSSKQQYDKIKEACESYKVEDLENGLYGIGYKSDHKSFDRLLEKNSVVSILHSPQL